MFCCYFFVRKPGAPSPSKIPSTFTRKYASSAIGEKLCQAVVDDSKADVKKLLKNASREDVNWQDEVHIIVCNFIFRGFSEL